jgi:hypothetical protein
MNTENTAATTEAVATTKKARAPKILTQSDKIALRIVEGVRENRDAWSKTESSDEKGSKTSFDSVIGTAKITVSRVEVKGKKSKEVIARASIVVTPEVGKPLTITGPLAARAWFALTHVPAVRGKAEVDVEAVNDAAAALGL